MIILGIETSCDDTAAAVCHNGEIISSFVSSQDIHTAFGGVVPEIASREHEKYLSIAVSEVVRQADIQIRDLDAVAVTRGPGLMGALLTGVSFAQGLASGLEILCIGVDHIEAHIFANIISRQEFIYPFLCLLISGGHTQIWRVDGLRCYQLLGETRDDAAGEAFDKGARILGLSYPGGPAIEKASKGGDEFAVDFPQAFLKSNDIEFSFSGLKTALLNYVHHQGKEYVRKHLKDIAASYQWAIVHILLSKLLQSVELTGIRSVAIGGGVAANMRLRSLSKEMLTGYNVLFPKKNLCTDNAEMVAFLAEKYLEAGFDDDTDIKVVPNLRLSS